MMDPTCFVLNATALILAGLALYRSSVRQEDCDDATAESRRQTARCEAATNRCIEVTRERQLEDVRSGEFAAPDPIEFSDLDSRWVTGPAFGQRITEDRSC